VLYSKGGIRKAEHLDRIGTLRTLPLRIPWLDFHFGRASFLCQKRLDKVRQTHIGEDGIFMLGISLTAVEASQQVSSAPVLSAVSVTVSRSSTEESP
jgi:hypothetical protein